VTQPRRQRHLNCNRRDLLNPIHPGDHWRAVVVRVGHKKPPGGCRRRPFSLASVSGRRVPLENRDEPSRFQFRAFLLVFARSLSPVMWAVKAAK
jgi:hypothetical protein